MDQISYFSFNYCLKKDCTVRSSLVNQFLQARVKLFLWFRTNYWLLKKKASSAGPMASLQPLVN